MVWLVSVIITTAIGVPVMLMHELAHILTALWLGVKVKRVGLSTKGLYTVRAAGTDIQNLMISLAGPGINFFFVVLCWNREGFFMHGFWLANLCFFVFNTLPIRGSDGERAWGCMKRLCTENVAKS